MLKLVPVFSQEQNFFNVIYTMFENRNYSYPIFLLVIIFRNSSTFETLQIETTPSDNKISSIFFIQMKFY